MKKDCFARKKKLENEGPGKQELLQKLLSILRH